MKGKFLVSSVRSLALIVLIFFMSLFPSPAFAAVTGQKNLLVFGVVGVLVFLGLIVVIGGVLLVVRARRLKAAQPSVQDLQPSVDPAVAPASETALTPAEAALAQSQGEAQTEVAQEGEASAPEESAPTIVRPMTSPVTSDITIELADAPADILQFIQDVMSGVARSSSIGTIYKGEQVMVTYDKGQFLLEYLNRPEKLLVAEGMPVFPAPEKEGRATGSDVSREEESAAEEPAEEIKEFPAGSEEAGSKEEAPASSLEPEERTEKTVQETGEIQEAAIPTIMIHRDALMKEEEALAQKEKSEILCPACGVTNDAALEFCLDCGAKIPGEPKAEAEEEVVEGPTSESTKEAEVQPETAGIERPSPGEEQVCPVCGTKFGNENKVCPNCGVKIL